MSDSKQEAVAEEVAEFTPQEKFIEKSFALAKEALLIGEVPIGCVIVHNNEIIGRGRNRVNQYKNGCRHAELEAIDDVVNRALQMKWKPEELLAKSEVYVTVEPCLMCASSLQHYRIPVIVYGCDNERFGGCGSVFDVFKINPDGFKSKIYKGYNADQAVLLLKQFYEDENPNCPGK